MHEILRDLGMTPANLTGTQSKYTCTGLYLEQQETTRGESKRTERHGETEGAAAMYTRLPSRC